MILQALETLVFILNNYFHCLLLSSIIVRWRRRGSSSKWWMTNLNKWIIIVILIRNSEFENCVSRSLRNYKKNSTSHKKRPYQIPQFETPPDSANRDHTGFRKLRPQRILQIETPPDSANWDLTGFRKLTSNWIPKIENIHFVCSSILVPLFL